MKCETYREDMLDVLYGEADGQTARRFQQHEQACQACRQEMCDLAGVRTELAGWGAPKASPIQIPGGGAGRVMPAWMLLAATVLVSVGASVALTRSIGREPATAVARDAEERTRELAARLAAQEARYEKELAALRAPASTRPTTEEKDGGAVLAQVEALLRASEARQAANLQTSLAEARERTDAQRRYDLAQMKAGLSYLDGKTGLQAARTTELVGHVLQASQRK